MRSLLQTLEKLRKQRPIGLLDGLPMSGRSLRATLDWFWSDLPTPADFVPGEKTTSTRRPWTWTIEDDGREGLDFEAYSTSLRAPYIQDVTPHTATILWRVSVPKGWNPAEWAPKLHARAWVAPRGIEWAAGTLYERAIVTRRVYAEDITRSYKYEGGTAFNRPIGHDDSDYWLHRFFDRPVVQLSVTFKDLLPGTVYHYHIESDGVLDEDDPELTNIVVADDIEFKTAPSPDQHQIVKFLAMGDLGPGNNHPSYFYDVFDLFHHVARMHGPQLWLALGDIDNDTDGHPNAMDPFFFNLYNAYHDRNNPKKTSHTRRAANTSVTAFRRPPYYGVLGGLPVYPIPGNHDIETSSEYWKMLSNGFRLPGFGYPSAEEAWCDAATWFNSEGFNADEVGVMSYFHTYRYGNIIFIALSLTGGGSQPWENAQKAALNTYLSSIQQAIENKDTWVVAYFHNHHNAIDDNNEYVRLFIDSGVDLVLAGHEHKFKQAMKERNGRSCRAVVAGTGGFGDNHGDPCFRPGFLLVEACGNVLKYWKYDTHQCNSDGSPKGRDFLNPRIKQFCRITKTGFGRHEIEEYVIDKPV